MKTKRILSCLLALMMLISLAACGGTPSETPSTAPSPSTSTSTTTGTDNGESDTPDTEAYTEQITISMSVLDAEKHGLSARNEFLNEKFNVSWQYIPVTWGDWMEKVRAWIAADDSPDLLWWDMKLHHTAEFRAWAEQGAFKAFPEDLSPWPEIVAQRGRLVSDDKVLTVDGQLYGWPAYRNNPEWLQNAYYPMFSYRRDWAKSVGMYKEGDVYTWEETKAMIRAVQEQDPGNNGANNTFGITSETWAFPGVFMEILGMAEDRNGYVKQDGKWVPYASTDAFVEELKFVTDLYREGYIWKDQMVVSGGEGADNYYAGRSFMFLGNNSPGWHNNTFDKMLDSGMIESTDQVGPMIVLSPKDNQTFWLTQTEDYWTVTNFSRKVDDAKQQRILDMWNWLLTEDGRRFTLAGIEGKDYKDNGDGTMTILWEKNPDGSFRTPYVDMAMNELTPPTLLAAPNETTRKDGYDAFEAIFDFIQNSPSYRIHPLNWELNTFGGEQFAQWGSFSSDLTAKIKEVLAAREDPEVMWDAFMNEMMPKYAPVMAELDANLK